MRRYLITITDQNDVPKIIKVQGLTFNGIFTSTDPSGLLTIPGAYNIEMGLNVSVLNSPMDGSFLRIYGVGLPLISQAAQFNPVWSKIPGKDKYCKIQIFAGMARGLPLANPNQFGLVASGIIQQAFGNWEGTSQTLDFVLMSPIDNTPPDPINISFSCQQGEALAPQIAKSLKIAFQKRNNGKGFPVIVDINPGLVATEEITHVQFNTQSFATFLNSLSLGMIQTPNYSGIQVFYNDDSIYVSDYSVPATKKPTQIKFNDLIGQPTWISPNTIAFKTVMRGDLRIGDQILMPQQLPQGGSISSYVINTAQSLSQYRSSSVFQGEFNVQSLRHLGMFRQADATSWVTVVYAWSPTAIPS